jgi:hypothetical protein
MRDRRFRLVILSPGQGSWFLKASTVQLMRTNVLADGVAVDTYGPGSQASDSGWISRS